MDDDEEWKDYLDDESYHNSDLESIESYESEQQIDETIEKNQLLDQKFKLVIFFNQDTVDIDQFNRQIKQINESMDDLKFVNEYYNNELLERELYFIDILNTYINEIKRNQKPGFLSKNQEKLLYEMYENIKTLREKCMKKEVKETEPLNSYLLDEKLEELIINEQKYLNKLAKEIYKKGLTSQLIKEPNRNSFENDSDYYHAYDQYIREISKYIPTINYVENMNITSIGSSFEKYKMSLKEKILELRELQKQLPIKQTDKIYFERRNKLKTILMKMDISNLIECAIQTETFNIIENVKPKELQTIHLHKQIYNKNLNVLSTLSPIVLEKIKNYSQSQQHTLKGVITKQLRKNFQKQLRQELNSEFMDQVEMEIYKLSENDINIYTNKINDILFILQYYPNFKNFNITPQQLALFEKEITFEIVINVTSIQKRRSTIRLLKSALMKNTLYKGLVKNYMCNVYAKRFELLIYDISKNKQIYNHYVEKLFTHINQNPNKVFKESKQKILLFLQLKFKKQKVTFDFSKLNIVSLQALLSQEKNNLEQLIKNKQPTKLKIKKIKHIEKRLVELIEKNEEEVYIEQFVPSEPEKITNWNNGIITQPVSKLHSFTSRAELLNEVVQAYKRKFMIDSLPIPNSYKNKIINYLELLDINDILQRNKRIQSKIIPLIEQLLPVQIIQEFNTFNNFNNYYYKKSNKKINEFVENFNVKYTHDIKDYYENGLFKILEHAKNPINFYTPTTQKNYYNMLEEVKIQPLPEYRRLRILYNPYTGIFGDPTGYLFDVEKLQSQGNGEPVMEQEPVTQIDPRTGQIKYSSHKVPIPGRDSFIKVPVLTSKKDIFDYQWIKVPHGKVAHMYLQNYDSCQQYTKETCNSKRGLGNSKCVYINNKCTAEYNVHVPNFGKSKNKINLKKDKSGIVYSLTMPQAQRRKALVKRIEFEKKKTGKTLRQAAVAVKRRLVLLRTFRKNKNTTQFAILNKDINFIDKKYLT